MKSPTRGMWFLRVFPKTSPLLEMITEKNTIENIKKKNYGDHVDRKFENKNKNKCLKGVYLTFHFTVAHSHHQHFKKINDRNLSTRIKKQ